MARFDYVLMTSLILTVYSRKGFGKWLLSIHYFPCGQVWNSKFRKLTVCYTKCLSRVLRRNLSESHFICEIRFFKRCKTANVSRVSSRAQVPVLRHDSDSPFHIRLSNRISAIKCDLFNLRFSIQFNSRFANFKTRLQYFVKLSEYFTCLRIHCDGTFSNSFLVSLFFHIFGFKISNIFYFFISCFSSSIMKNVFRCKKWKHEKNLF